MKKISIIGMGLLVAFSTILYSCMSDEAESETSYLPFKSSKDGKWGMIGTDGTVLFEEEFKDEPTAAMNGRFLVKNGNDLWEIYTAEEKPEKIGGEYLKVLDFTASVTPSVRKNEKICLIDKNGEVKATLDKANNKNIIRCSKFLYGFATIVTDDNQSGIINTKGEVVIEPKYDHVTPFAGGKFAAMKRDENLSTIEILNKSGEKIVEFKIGSDQKYNDLNIGASTSDYLAVCSSVDGEEQWGYIDFSKNPVIKPSSKIKYLKEVKGKNFIYYDGQNYGVMNFDGETVLRAKYDNLSWADDNVLIAYDSKDKYSLINLDGDRITKEEYLSILPFFDHKHAAVKIDDNSWGFINKDGEELKLKNAPDIYYLDKHETWGYVESDFLDIDAIVSRLKLTNKGFMGLNIDMGTQQIIKAYKEIEGNTMSYDMTPDGLGWRNKLEASTSYQEIRMSLYLSCTGSFAKYVDGSYVWQDVHPFIIDATISGNKLEGKTELLYAKIAAMIKSYGKVMRENSRAAVVMLTEDKGWCLYCDNDAVYLRIGIGDEYQEDIDRYAKDGETTKEYIKPQSRDQYDDSDSIAVLDSTDVY